MSGSEGRCHWGWGQSHTPWRYRVPSTSHGSQRGHQQLPVRQGWASTGGHITPACRGGPCSGYSRGCRSCLGSALTTLHNNVGEAGGGGGGEVGGLGPLVSSSLLPQAEAAVHTAEPNQHAAHRSTTTTTTCRPWDAARVHRAGVHRAATIHTTRTSRSTGTTPCIRVGVSEHCRSIQGRRAVRIQQHGLGR